MDKVLIIEDDLDMQEGLAFSLETEGYKIITATTMKDGMDVLEKESLQALILDCNLPDGNGFEFCVRTRKFSSIPILMLTARDTEMDEVKALELGVDDYMSKPFSLAVLKVRLKKLIQKTRKEVTIQSNGVTLDSSTCKVYKDGHEIDCTKIEYRLLYYMIENKNQVLSKEQILASVWDVDGKFVDENTVSVNIRRIRQKIERDSGQPEYIQTVYGIGYLWKEEK